MSKDSDWIAALEKAGHRPIKNDDGSLDIFAHSNGHHNGPACELCGKGWCWHCVKETAVKKCSASRKRAA